MQFPSTPFPRKPSRSLLAASSRALPAIALSVLSAIALTSRPAMAQAAGQPAPPPSSSSDTQTAQVVEKTSDFSKRDVALSAFGVFTSATNGSFIRIDPSSSGGGMISYRQSPRWWFGYEFNYGNSRYSESYNKGLYRVDHDANELTAAYLIKSPVAYYKLRPFIGFGGGVMILSPSTYGGVLVPTGKTPGTQSGPLFVFSIGADRSFGEHFGVRFQYRDDVFKAPAFGLVQLDARKLRSSNQPAIGVYYRF